LTEDESCSDAGVLDGIDLPQLQPNSSQTLAGAGQSQAPEIRHVEEVPGGRGRGKEDPGGEGVPQDPTHQREDRDAAQQVPEVQLPTDATIAV
jgi:hypothetical protein